MAFAASIIGSDPSLGVFYGLGLLGGALFGSVTTTSRDAIEGFGIDQSKTLLI